MFSYAQHQKYTTDENKKITFVHLENMYEQRVKHSPSYM